MTARTVDRIVLALNSSPPPAAEAPKVRNSSISLGTAPFVASVFTDVFLPESPASYTTDDNTIKSTIDGNIRGLRTNNSADPFYTGRVAFFGGRCNHFDSLCPPEAVNLTQQPLSNTVRTGLINKTCDEILVLDRAVDNALMKIEKQQTDPIDAAATKAMYELFSPGRELPQYLSDIISNFTRGAPGLTSRDNWRYSLSLICVSNDWEAR